MKPIRIVVFFTLLFSWVSFAKSATPGEIEQLIQQGNFTQAKKAIAVLIAEGQLTPLEIYDWNVRSQILGRIEHDFRLERPAIMDYVKRYYPEADDAMLDKFEAENTLEMRIIDGKKRYFVNAAPNLFRLDTAAKQRKLEVDQPQPTPLDLTFLKHIPQVISDTKRLGTPQGEPVRMKVRYTVRLKDGVVPVGETVRCWLPYPRSDHRRQKDVELISVNSPNYIISPDEYLHKSLYMEKTVEAGQPTVFQLEFAYTSIPEWFDLKPEQVKPYDKTSELYKKYTAERDTHVIFTDKIKKLSEEAIGDEKEPLQIVQKTWEYITDNYPWASAIEYSTVENHPERVIDTGRGDCGMVSLLLITLCRYNGDPAKWQSGFMTPPGGVNLHDWAEVYFEGVGWVPIDPSLGHRKRFFDPDDKDSANFFSRGTDAYRWIVNEDYSDSFFPAKIHLRSETVDFQRGELEWKGGNLYFNDWTYTFEVEYLDK